jgi:hypothetical protein
MKCFEGLYSIVHTVTTHCPEMLPLGELDHNSTVTPWKSSPPIPLFLKQLHQL